MRAETSASVAWVAMGAALGGVALGGAAVYLGLMADPTALPPVMGASVAGVTPQTTRPAEEPAADATRAEATSLADAVAGTRDTVVNLHTGRGLGAGVVVDPAGVVLTNYHVVADVLRAPRPALLGGVAERSGSTPRVSARFENGRELPAVVLFADRNEDIALLRLQPADTAERFAAATLGQSSRLRVGEDVFAIGNPFGLTHTLSRGIVSALDRTDALPNRSVPVIQLDAAINTGNSGGPLFNLDGELVGIVTGRLATGNPRARSEGIAFALPIDHVRAFLRAVTAETEGRSGVIGVETSAKVSRKRLQAHGYEVGLGIREVWNGYPAAEAGLQPGDVVVEMRHRRFDGHAPSELLEELQTTVRALFPGERLPVTVLRGDERVELELEVAAASVRDQALFDMQDLFGILLEPQADEPVVRGLTRGSVLDRIKAKTALEGSRVVQILGRKVTSLEQLGATVGKLRAAAEGGQGMTVSVVLQLEDGRRIPLDLPVAPR